MFLKMAGWIALFAAAAIAQDSAPPGLLRGTLVSWEGTSQSGRFMFHASEDHVYFCTYDEKTYFERDTQRITMAGAEKGDRLEVVSDQKQGSNVCYARTVHVLENPRTYLVPGVRPRLHVSKTPAPPFRPRGDLTLSGSVLRVTPDSLILRSRSGERKIVRLRTDTRYLTEGQTADANSLHVNTLVFVRCERNLDNEMEAYQVIWGEILQPAR